MVLPLIAGAVGLLSSMPRPNPNAGVANALAGLAAVQSRNRFEREQKELEFHQKHGRGIADRRQTLDETTQAWNQKMDQANKAVELLEKRERDRSMRDAIDPILGILGIGHMLPPGQGGAPGDPSAQALTNAFGMGMGEDWMFKPPGAATPAAPMDPEDAALAELEKAQRDRDEADRTRAEWDPETPGPAATALGAPPGKEPFDPNQPREADPLAPAGSAARERAREGQESTPYIPAPAAPVSPDSPRVAGGASTDDMPGSKDPGFYPSEAPAPAQQAEAEPIGQAPAPARAATPVPPPSPEPEAPPPAPAGPDINAQIEYLLKHPPRPGQAPVLPKSLQAPPVAPPQTAAIAPPGKTEKAAPPALPSQPGQAPWSLGTGLMPPGDQDMSRHERVNRQRLIEMTKGWIAYNKNLFPEGKAGEAVTAAVGAITSGAIRDEKTLMQYFRDLMQTPTRLESDQIAANRPRGGSGREPNYYSQGANQALGILRADPAIKERWMLAESAERSLEAYLKNPTSSAAQAKFQRDFALAMNKGTLTDKDATAPEQYQSWLQRTQKWLSVGLEGKLPQWQLDEMVAILRTGLERTYREQEGEFNSQIDGGQYMAEQPITMRQGWASKMHEIHGRRKYFNADAVKRIANGAADPGQVTVDDAPATGGAPAPGKPLSAGAQGLLNRMRGK